MAPLSETLIGTWELISREDRNAAGESRPERMLGADPLGLLIHDHAGRFALQLMKRERTMSSGYDAYFGTYIVDDEQGIVTQTLHGSLSPEQLGAVVTRQVVIDGDALTIKLDTTNADGERVTRTLRWRRVA